jgi:hypothetical protein
MVPALGVVDGPRLDGRAGVAAAAGRWVAWVLLEVSTLEVTGGRSIDVEAGGFV